MAVQQSSSEPSHATRHRQRVTLRSPAFFEGRWVQETLECGHTITVYPACDALIAKYRDCPECKSISTQLSESRASDISAQAKTGRKVKVSDLTRPLPRPGQIILNSVLLYISDQAQHCELTDRDAYTLALAIIRMARRGSMNPFQQGCFAAFGGSWESYAKRRAEFKKLENDEFLRALPDYLPSETVAIARRRLP
jgi:hypothetical protein